MYHLRRFSIASVCVGSVIFVFWLLPLLLNPTPPTAEQRRRDHAWVSTSHHWLDRQACRWFSLCGVQHLRRDLPERLRKAPDNDSGDLRLELRSLSAPIDSLQWRTRESLGDESWEIAGQDQATEAEAAVVQETAPQPEHDAVSAADSSSDKKAIPDYVLAYAPMVHLFSDEHFWPSHIGEHVKHMEAFTNGSALTHPFPLTLDNMAQLNNETGKVYLTSMDDVEERPAWLLSRANKPIPFADDENSDGDNQGDGQRKPREDGSGHATDPRRKYPDDTTWFDVDRDHPLHQLSDPRKILSLDRHPRMDGPEDTRAHRSRIENLHQAAGGVSGFANVVNAAVAGAATAVDAIVPLETAAATDGKTPTQQKPIVVVEPQYGHKPDDSGYSAAPAILVMVDKGSGIMDAFWFFFYSYNLGQTVLGVRYGNHIGDWEHCMIRFENGVPRALFLSEHEGGQAYAWGALEKFQPKRSADEDANLPPLPKRPVIYSAVGSHAMYAVPGNHPYVLPFQMLKDVTDKGPLWDPAKNNLAYHYDYVIGENEAGSNEDIDEGDDESEISDNSGDDDGDDTTSPLLTSLTPAASNPDAPTSWFHFTGTWGDELYELGDKRQWRLFGQYHYITGPVGPKFKNLQRKKVCQTKRCRILFHLEDGGTWYH
ncbi:vacuolar sorting-associated protein [Grosmannia clavigera kw1407]|uniref:Vacuolar sorting-associated protein n=1 Tax=Grosmannia clavigera (strain kw1407 / UAMH 11150) TaxID=655863 RepID=F0XJQ3_GROCL|nr:vacuolar sorting-associated protein [Grosmannia clavigera kw1407]EFX02407.1 vacuolar sorting-associated protein [Grosmannia clavigera kw1407]